MAVGDAYVFPGFLTPVDLLTQLFFSKPPITFLTCFCRGERRKYAGKKSRLNGESNSQPPGHESDMLTTESPGRGKLVLKNVIKLAEGSLNNIFQDSFNKILSEHLIHDRSYISCLKDPSHHDVLVNVP